MTPEEAKDLHRLELHYKNMPIQIYWKFYHKKNENFRIKNSDIFSYFCWKHNLWVLVRTASTRRLNEYRLHEAVLTSTHMLF